MKYYTESISAESKKITIEFISEKFTLYEWLSNKSTWEKKKFDWKNKKLEWENELKQLLEENGYSKYAKGLCEIFMKKISNVMEDVGNEKMKRIENVINKLEHEKLHKSANAHKPKN